MTRAQSPYQAVLFDLDGTLLDTAPDFTRILNQLLVKHRREPLPEAKIRSIISDGSAAMIAHAFDCEPADSYFDQVRGEFLSMYQDQVCVETRLFPGIQTVLHQLGDNDLPWGIVTNKPSTYTVPLLAALALEPAPDTVVCPDHVSRVKPDPESVLLACQHLDSEPERVLFIGDHKRDIDAGRAAGTTTVAASYGYLEANEDITRWNAHHTIECARDLLPIIF